MEGIRAIKRFILFLVLVGGITVLLIIKDVPALTFLKKSGDMGFIPPTPSYYVQSPENPVSIGFSPSGRFLAIGGESDRIVIMDMLKKTCSKVRINAPVTAVVISLSFSPDGKYIAAAGDFKGSNIRIIDRTKGSETVSFEERAIASHVAFSPDGKYILSVNYSALKVWDINNRKLIRILPDNDMPTRAFFVNKGENIITNQGLKLWNWINGESRGRLVSRGGLFSRISCEGGNCAFAGMDGLYLFDSGSMSMKTLTSRVSGNITEIAYNRRTGVTAYVIDDMKLVLADSAGSVIASRGIVGPVRAVAFDPDGSVLALCSGDSIAVFDMKGGNGSAAGIIGVLNEKIGYIKEKVKLLKGRIM